LTPLDHDGSTYEIDHLGIGSASQWGEFEVYCDGEEVARFTLVQSVLRPWSLPAGLPVSADELIRLARQALELLDARAADLDGFAHRRAEALLADHRRVREAAAARGSYGVKALVPPDVVAVFALLPPVV